MAPPDTNTMNDEPEQRRMPHEHRDASLADFTGWPDVTAATGEIRDEPVFSCSSCTAWSTGSIAIWPTSIEIGLRWGGDGSGRCETDAVASWWLHERDDELVVTLAAGDLLQTRLPLSAAAALRTALTEALGTHSGPGSDHAVSVGVA